MYTGLHVKYLLLLSDFKETCILKKSVFSRQIFVEFDVQVTVHCEKKIIIINPTTCTNFSKIFLG